MTSRAPVLLRAHERGILNRPLHDIAGIRLAADDTHVMLRGRLPQAQELPDKDADPDPRDVEPVEERVRRHQRLELRGVLPPAAACGVPLPA